MLIVTNLLFVVKDQGYKHLVGFQLGLVGLDQRSRLLTLGCYTFCFCYPGLQVKVVSLMLIVTRLLFVVKGQGYKHLVGFQLLLVVLDQRSRL